MENNLPPGTASRRPIDLFRSSVQPPVAATPTADLGVEVSQRSWVLLPSDVQLLTRPDGSEWCLGRGAYGEVFRGLMGGTIPVAVKYLLADVGNQASVVQAIVKEISLLRVRYGGRRFIIIYMYVAMYICIYVCVYSVPMGVDVCGQGCVCLPKPGAGMVLPLCPVLLLLFLTLCT